MKAAIFLVVTCFAFVILPAHGGHMATYSYQVDPDAIYLEFSIEKGILDHFPMERKCETFELTKAFCLLSYIAEHSSLTLNGKEIDFKFDHAEQSKDYFLLQMTAIGSFDQIESFTLENHCFYEFDQTFQNRIVLSRDGKTTSYRLNHQRNSITIQ